MIINKYVYCGTLFVAIVSGCGQTGPLYLPDAPPPIHVEPEPDPEPDEGSEDNYFDEMEQ